MTTKKVISFTQTSMYKSCKLKWYFYAVKKIEPKRLRPALSFGSCGHILLEAHYRGKNIDDAAKMWADQTINSADWFDEDIEEIDRIAKEAHGAVNYYIKCHPEDKDWVILDIEKYFKIPLTGTNLMVEGYFDLVAKESIDSRNVWIVEHKFPRQSLRSDTDLELNQQLHMYDWVATKLNEYKPYKVIGCLYNQILAKQPKIPKLNRDGTMSKAAITTTWDVYAKELEKHGLNPMDYLDMQSKLEVNEFNRRTKIITSDIEKKNFVLDLQRVAWEMTKRTSHLYGAYDFNCRGCDFKEICVENLKGGDIEFIIENSFRPRKEHREGNKKEE